MRVAAEERFQINEAHSRAHQSDGGGVSNWVGELSNLPARRRSSSFISRTISPLVGSAGVQWLLGWGQSKSPSSCRVRCERHRRLLRANACSFEAVNFADMHSAMADNVLRLGGVSIAAHHGSQDDRLDGIVRTPPVDSRKTSAAWTKSSGLFQSANLT